MKGMTVKNRTVLLASALLAAVGVGVGGGAALDAHFSKSTKTVVRQVPVGNGQVAASKSSLTVGEIYRRSYKGVVEITVTTQTNPQLFGGSQTQQAQGSGFVYNDNGDIVTNEHVVDGASSIAVKFWNGSIYKAKLVGSDSSTDRAVI